VAVLGTNAHLPWEQPPLNLRQRRIGERQADETQIHHDHETGKDDDAGDVRVSING